MDAITVGNVRITGDFDAHLRDTKRRRACLCGSVNDCRRGRALWGYGNVCRRCRRLWAERHGKPWEGEYFLRASRIPEGAPPMHRRKGAK